MSNLENSKRIFSTPMIIVGFIGSIVIVFSSIYFLLFFEAPSNELVTYTDKNNPIVFGEEIYDKEAVIKNETIYYPLTFVQDYIDDGIILDQESKSIILTTKDNVFQMPSDSLTYFVNEEETNLEFPTFIFEKDIPYIALEPLLSIYPIDVTHYEDTGIHIVRKDGDALLLGIVKERKNEDTLRLRRKASVTEPFVDEVVNGESLVIEKEENNFYYVRKENGVAGYIDKDAVTINETIVIESKVETKQYNLPSLTWPINLTWEAVYTQNPNTSKLPEMPGLNVVSPTWFKLKNNSGDITNLGSTDYMKWAKDNNLHIWGLFSNDFDPEKTHEAFKDFKTRQKIIRQLLQYSETYQLDGINIDIENVYEEDGPLITQFVKESVPYFHRAGLIVSMDITFISDSGMWSRFYEREKLKNVVDYMVVMAYDEHWATSPQAGSVASLPWVESNLQRLLEVVPADRLILGIPLYARIWKEAETEGGNVEVSSSAHDMDFIQNWLRNHDVKVTYDEHSGQNYGEYRDDKEKATYKVWIEDATSLSKRVQLVHQYKLAGVATWSRSFSDEKAWSSIHDSLKQIDAVKK